MAYIYNQYPRKKWPKKKKAELERVIYKSVDIEQFFVPNEEFMARENKEENKE